WVIAVTEHSQQHLRCLCSEGLILNVRVALYQPDVAREIALQCVDEGLIRRRIVKSLSRDSIAVESTVWYEKNSVGSSMAQSGGYFPPHRGHLVCVQSYIRYLGAVPDQ